MIEEALARHGAMHVDTMQDAPAKMAGILKDPRGSKPIVVGVTPGENRGFPRLN
jgi:hypothetical protein